MRCKFCNSRDLILKQCIKSSIIKSPFLTNLSEYNTNNKIQVYECKNCGNIIREVNDI